MKKLNFLGVGAFCLLAIAVSTSPASSETTTTPLEPSPLASQNVITIVDAQICEEIVDHEPVSSSDVFTGEILKLHCYSKIESSEETEIRHIWSFSNNIVAEIPLRIGISSGWRTNSSKNIRSVDKGNWKVEIVDTNDNVLKTLQFVVN